MNTMRNGGRNKGFTLIEMLIVIAILAILYSLAAASVSGMQHEAKMACAKGDLKTLELALNSYLKNRGSCPPADGYQTALLNAKPPIIDRNLMDPFGGSVNIMYPYSVSNNGDFYVVYSVGLKRDGYASVSDNGIILIEGSAIYETNGYSD